MAQQMISCLVMVRNGVGVAPPSFLPCSKACLIPSGFVRFCVLVLLKCLKGLWLIKFPHQMAIYYCNIAMKMSSASPKFPWANILGVSAARGQSPLSKNGCVPPWAHSASLFRADRSLKLFTGLASGRRLMSLPTVRRRWTRCRSLRRPVDKHTGPTGCRS